MGLNHWKPAGNYNVGDCMPFYKDGLFHLYYLLDQGHHNHPVVGQLGGHQWAHATSADLKEWDTSHPLALPLDFEAGESSNCTGSIMEWQGKVYAFYALRSRHFKGEQFRVAVSNDGGYTFEKWSEPELSVQPEGCTPDFRDPEVFVGADGLIHLLITTQEIVREGGVAITTGELLHYTTSDLIHYQRKESLLQTVPTPECANYFQWGDYYYLTYGFWNATRYLYSRQPWGPWQTATLDIAACRQCRVMKTAPWREGRRIGVAWSATLVEGSYKFGGRMLFRELLQQPDGTLGTKFVEEVIERSHLLPFSDTEISSSQSTSWKLLGTTGRNFLLSAEIDFAPGTHEFGILISDTQGVGHRRMVAFTPGRGEVASLFGDHIVQIPGVDYRRGRIRIRLIRTGDLLDIEVDGCRTMVSPGVDFEGSAVAFYVTAGKAVICHWQP